MANGIKSSERVKAFGEVFTPYEIVNDMLDLVDEQYKDLITDEYISKIYLEPACGDGQFLIEILYRKLEKIKGLSEDERPLAMVKALSSIYGIDIQADNVEIARKRMKALLLGKNVSTFSKDKPAEYMQIDLGIEVSEALDKVIDYILTSNIIVGNTLEPYDVELKAYNWQDDSGHLVISKCLLSDLDTECIEHEVMKYADIADLYEGDHIDIGDVADLYKEEASSTAVPAKKETKAKPKKKSNGPPDLDI